MLYLDEDQFFNQEAESKRAGNNDSGSNLPTGYQGYQTLSAGLTEPTQAPILLPNYASGYAPNQQSVSETLNYHLDQINLLTSESQTLANHNALNQPIEFMQQENFVETNNGNFPQEENTVFSPQPAQEPFAFDGSIQPNDIGLQSANQASFSSNAPQLYGYLPMQQVPPEFLGELYANQPSDYAPQNGTNGNVLSAPDQNESVPDNPLIDTNTTEPGKSNQKSGVDSTDAKDAGQNSGDDQYTSKKPEDTLPKSCGMLF
ncbi:hypothetical protein EB796_020293 [Bugula neritina]|uniref:Uncharacterized protein n=1 Tax=Bugula neritina TaxID=10212 RepID=A0A7J7J5C5_BUGNE|nr:hypothetical protein EB796_020293 [Bugula neritina]